MTKDCLLRFVIPHLKLSIWIIDIALSAHRPATIPAAFSAGREIPRVIIDWVVFVFVDHTVFAASPALNPGGVISHVAVLRAYPSLQFLIEAKFINRYSFSHWTFSPTFPKMLSCRPRI